MSDTVLRLENITKRFGPLLANDAISLSLGRGEVLGLLGENGAGKSTLVSILFGHYRADAGQVTAFGQPLPPGQPRAALAAGIGMVHQHSTLADNLSVLDNVMLGTEPWWRPWSQRAAAQAQLLATAQRFGLPVDPQARVATLSVGERQRVEILKALVRGARVLILDEPTAVLTPQESESLFATLQQMVAQGLSIIFISHKLDEVLRVCHRVAVLRSGRLVAESPAAQATPALLAQWMVGHEVAPPSRRPAQRVGEVVAQLKGVHAGSGRGALQGVDLALPAGEIVAIAGVSGNGQATLAELLCGVLAPTGGEIRFGSQTLQGPGRTPVPTLVSQGLARIPEDRHGTALVGDLPLWENAVSERLHTPAFSRRFGGLRWVRRDAAQAQAQRLMEQFDVRGAGLQAPVRALSGGNMQKLILGRALRAPDGDAAPKLIVAHQPTWGLDVGAVAHVQQRLIEARDGGAAVLLISDDLDEVMMLGDRIAVMHGGRLTPARPAADWSRQTLGLAMAGADDHPADTAGAAHGAAAAH